MSLVYFKTKDSDINVQMDGETSISVSKSNNISNSSVMSGASVSDNIQEGNIQISVEGVVTYSKTSSQEDNPTPSEWVSLIEKAIKNKRIFTLVYNKHESGKPLLKDYDNVVISDYGYTVDRFEDTITARITFKEIYITDAAIVTELPPLPSSEAAKEIPTATENGASTSTEVDKEKSKTFYSYVGGGVASATAAVDALVPTE